MEKHEIKIDLTEYPQEIHPFLEGARIYDSSCSPNAQVLYSDQGYFIKIAPGGELQKEAELAFDFAKRGLGVDVVAYVTVDTDRDYLVTRAAKGEDALSFLDEPEKLCQMLAEAMKILHGQALDGAPVSACMENYRKLQDSTEPENDVNMEAMKRINADTLIHGDFCLPNVMFDDGRFRAFIDLGQAGAGDRHIDIYWALWSLNYNLKTDAYTDYFLDLYGRENVDMEVLKFVAEMEK